MKQAILGKKIGMTQLFREDGTMIPVTVVLAGPCPVTQVKTVEHDGYDAVQMAFQPVREKLITKPQMGHLRKAGVEAHRYVKEFKLDDCAKYAVGDVIKADTFASGDKVDLQATSSVGTRPAAERPTAPTPIALPVQWAHAPTPVRSSKPSTSPAIWVMSASRFRTSKSSVRMQNAICSSSRAQSPVQRAVLFLSAARLNKRRNNHA